MQKNQKQKLLTFCVITFCVNRIEIGLKNKALLKHMYDINLGYCMVENVVPVEKTVF